VNTIVRVRPNQICIEGGMMNLGKRQAIGSDKLHGVLFLNANRASPGFVIRAEAQHAAGDPGFRLSGGESGGSVGPTFCSAGFNPASKLRLLGVGPATASDAILERRIVLA
jgi:hypothetical protein